MKVSAKSAKRNTYNLIGELLKVYILMEQLRTYVHHGMQEHCLEALN